jgi:hypothetical protein
MASELLPHRLWELIEPFLPATKAKPKCCVAAFLGKCFLKSWGVAPA